MWIEDLENFIKVYLAYRNELEGKQDSSHRMRIDKIKKKVDSKVSHMQVEYNEEQEEKEEEDKIVKSVKKKTESV